MRAFAKGAPVRVLAAAYTGVQDIYWFVPASSPITSVKDISDKHTIAYSTNGSTSDSVLRALIAAELPATHRAQEKLKAVTGSAAFICVGERCSLPVTEPDKIAPAVATMRA